MVKIVRVHNTANVDAANMHLSSLAMCVTVFLCMCIICVVAVDVSGNPCVLNYVRN